MKVFLRRKNNTINAEGIYDPKAKTMTVLAGSIVSKTITLTGTFRSGRTIERYRKQYCRGNKVKEDVLFKSPSTAANFVTGNSTNGLIAWKDAKGNSLRELLKEDV